MSVPRSRLPRASIIPSLVLVLGCSPDVTLVPAGFAAPDADTAGAVQRVQLDVTAIVVGPDSAIAAAVGSPGGVLTDAQVRIQRGGSPPLTAQTDSAGQARFADLLPGAYTVSVLRLLNPGERAGLDSLAADVNAFGGARTADVRAPISETTVVVTAARRGTLIISELFPSRWLGPPEYSFGNYLEIYNSSDSVIYLDGKLLGDGPFWWYDQSGGAMGDFPCDSTQQWQADPQGIWARWLSRFPGTGREYPLAPGESAVIATDAVDHRVVDPRWPDLSRASFELIGPSDADNPAVPNMVIVSEQGSDPLGHGERFDATAGRIWFLADSTDVTVLPRIQPGNYGEALPRIPAAKVLDVTAMTAPVSTLASLGVQLCPLMIAPGLDAQPGRLFDPAAFYSIQRLWLGTLDDGRAVLLRTKATASDFHVVSAPTPGVVP